MGKRKGGNFEREISEKLSLWLTNGQNNECVWRTEASGARATQRSKRKKVKDTMFGDLCSSDPSLQGFFNLISIELKSGYFVSKSKSKKTEKTTITNWSFNDIIDSSQERNPFFKFWDQCVTDAGKSNREPWLIFRRNRRNACLAMTTEMFEAFQKFKDYRFSSWYIKIERIFQYDATSYTICNLDSFFMHFPYNEMLLRGPITRTLMRRRAN